MISCLDSSCLARPRACKDTGPSGRRLRCVKALECSDRTEVLSYLFSKAGEEMAAFVATVGLALSEEDVTRIPRFDQLSEEEQTRYLEEIKQSVQRHLGFSSMHQVSIWI